MFVPIVPLQTLYDEAFISLYNVCYTSLPVLTLAIFDQVTEGADPAGTAAAEFLQSMITPLP